MNGLSTKNTQIEVAPAYHGYRLRVAERRSHSCDDRCIRIYGIARNAPVYLHAVASPTRTPIDKCLAPVKVERGRSTREKRRSVEKTPRGRSTTLLRL